MLKRICYVIPTLSVGGTEAQLVNLIGGLVRDHEVTVVCTRQPGAFAGDVRRLGGFVYVLGARSGWDFTVRRKLAKVFRGHRPDIVHSFMFGFDLPVNRAAVDVGAPVIISSRRQLADWKKARHIRVQKKANRYVNAIVANSQAARNFAIEQENANPALFRVIHNGIDTRRFAPRLPIERSLEEPDRNNLRLRFRIPFHRHVIGMVANFSPVKDHDLFVETARILGQRRADVHFLMVGKGKTFKAVQRKIAAEQVEDRFTQLTAFDEIRDLYELMTVSVLTSRNEGFPNAIMEAMAMGTPIVAADVGGIPELVKHNETGLLVSSRDPEAFADAIERLLEQPDERHAMARRARDFICDQFAIEKMIEQYRDLYAALLAQHIDGKD